MEAGRFYFVSDSFYERFKDCGLVDNKAEKGGEEHNRPCCYMFKFDNTPNNEIYWMIPISSRVEKYILNEYIDVNTLKNPQGLFCDYGC